MTDSTSSLLTAFSSAHDGDLLYALEIQGLFEDHFDHLKPLVKINDYEYLPSQVLKSVDPDAYQEELLKFVEWQVSANNCGRGRHPRNNSVPDCDGRWYSRPRFQDNFLVILSLIVVLDFSFSFSFPVSGRFHPICP